MNRPLVVDAGPLIALAHLDLLDLLDRLDERIEVPQAILEECLFQPELEDARRIEDWARTGTASVVDAADTSAEIAEEIHRGERSVLARALEIGGIAVLDDRGARRAARGLGVPRIGTGGLLTLAKRRGEIELVAPMLDELISSNYYISKSVRRRILEAAGELDETDRSDR